MLGPILLALLSTLPGANGDSPSFADTKVGTVSAGDARLNDLCFVDSQHGWAVGDRGVVWRTDDGGRHWQRQPSGVDCNLQGVCFLNSEFGWAAGGLSHPYTHGSAGVVLATRDGGKTWTHDAKLFVPALHRIGFFDPHYGWAIGCRSTMYPSGVFTTDDGGRSWQPLPGDNPAGWTTADFLDPRHGLIAGRNGSIALVRGRELESLGTAGPELRAFAQTRLSGRTGADGWLVGEGGLVGTVPISMPPKMGVSPLTPAPNLPKAARHFDFAALAVRGPQCWIAGSPGTRVFYTPDAGRTWSVFDTGSPVPLRAMQFVDDQHGWAAGELGTILATADGGRTWQTQRAGGSQAALLAVFAEADDVPLELLARLSGNDGYLSVVEVLGRRDIEIAPRDDVPLADRLHEAVVRVGGCAADAAWQFPLRQAGLRVGSPQIVEAWDRVNDGHGLEALRARVVRQIRTWRPQAMVIDDARREDDDPLMFLVHQAVMQAIDEAGQPGAFAEQMAETRLKPWRVKQVYAAMPPGSRGASDLTTAQFMPGLGRSPAEAAAEPRGLVQDRWSPSPPTLGFRLLAGGAAESQRRDLLIGLGMSPGTAARRELPRPPTERLDLLQRIARKRRFVEAILGQSKRAAWSSEQLVGQIDELTRDLDAESAGQIVYQLADQYYRSGRWPAAADTFQLLVDRYPRHSLTPSALRWLVQYYASAETAWRVQHDVSTQQKRFERAAALGAEIERTRFDQFIEPAVRFPLAAAYRGLGQPRQADRFYQSQSRDDSHDAWWACAQGEIRLADPKNPRRRPQLTCVRAKERPHLDGVLDDPVWQHAKPAAIQSAQHDDGDWPAEVRLAYDDEFLYVAIRCRTAPSAANVDGDSPIFADTKAGTVPARRPRDADLSGHDRVELFLDIDRDYFTYYRLAIDDRGWTHDSCWGDDTWNPTWFVAARREKGQWTAEAAIPLAELCGRRPGPQDVWAVGVQRVAPGVGFQSWTTPAAVTVLPDGFGYLTFE